MKKTTYLSNLFLIVFLLVLSPFLSCEKYLDAKPDKTQVIITNLVDLQGLLDNYSVMNRSSPVVSTVTADEYYLSLAAYASCNINDQTNYLWNSSATYLNSWRQPYQVVYYSNVVLQELPNVAIQ